eukprot:gene15975-21681_t
MSQDGMPYSMINKIKTECELESLTVGSRLSDAYNSYNESVELKERTINSFFTDHLGFIHHDKENAVARKKINIDVINRNNNHSHYWAIENKWIYIMGDTYAKQTWNVFSKAVKGESSSVDNDLEKKCLPQAAHGTQESVDVKKSRKKSSNNCTLSDRITCHSQGFGSNGKLSYDWKHFPFEDYDKWLFGETGLWSSANNYSFPDILVIQVGTHTCIHSTVQDDIIVEITKKHESDIALLMKTVHDTIIKASLAINNTKKTTVIVMTASREHNADSRSDICVWRTNRILGYEAHVNGFPVLEREEIEHRLLFKSEHSHIPGVIPPVQTSSMNIDYPSDKIIATSLLTMITCLELNGTIPHHHSHHHGHHRHHLLQNISRVN